MQAEDKAKEKALNEIKKLVKSFDEDKEEYKNKDYNEETTRVQFINPFWKALGWDIDNKDGTREVKHEDRIKIEGKTKKPDYSFWLKGNRLFFIEAKKPSIPIKTDTDAAYQIRRYGWNAEMGISIITDFEEFAVYDCTVKPKENDKADNARLKILTYTDYIKDEGFNYIWDTFSKESVEKDSLDRYIQIEKKGTTTVDREFLQSLDEWRKKLVQNIALLKHNGGVEKIECIEIKRQNISNKSVKTQIKHKSASKLSVIAKI